MARVLVTRSLPGALATQRRLEGAGHDVILAPMLAISPMAFDRDFRGASALLFTSANGVRAAAAAVSLRDVPVFCVGDGTAGAAHAAGYRRVASAAGDVVALADLCARELSPSEGRLLHIAGNDRAGDLAAALSRSGFKVESRVAYQAVPAEALDASAAAALQAGPPSLDAAVFHSPRGARTLARLAAQHAGVRRMRALCLSVAIAEAAKAAPWLEILVAERPDDADLCQLVEQASATKA